MYHSKKTSSTQLPSSLSTIAIAVISINAACVSSSVLAEEPMALPALVVTGEKMDKDIKETTTAVTVIAKENYENGESKEVNDIVTVTPNVTSAGFGTINIRGVNGAGAAVGGNAFMTGGRPRISTSVDGVTESWGGYNFTPAQLWDTQQVEVLRGPQSTTQGTNAIGGAVIIKTNDPTFTSESAVRLGLEQYENDNLNYNLAIMNNGVLVEDELAYRIAFDGTKGEGFLNYAQENSELDDGPDVNDSESQNFRGKLLWKPQNIDGLEAKLTLVHRKNTGEYLSWANDSDNDFSSQTMTLDSTNNQNTRLQDSTVDTISTEISYNISNQTKNILQVSYNDYTAYFDEYPGDTIAKKTEKRITVENRLIFTPSDSNLSGFIGAYASQADTTLDVDFTTWINNFYVADGTKTTLALYGDTAYSLSDRATLNIGGRIENENQDRTLVRRSTQTLNQDEDTTVFLPKLSATYKLNQNTTLGASISRGYNGGGAALDWSDYSYYTYDKEEVTAYEFSSKSQFQNFNINASVFFNDYSDYQAYTSDRLENVKSAHTYGAELEAVVFVNEDLEIRGSIGTLQTKVDSTDADTSSWNGNEITYSPDLNLGLGFTQYIGDNWSFGADATYVGEYYSDLDNTEDYKAGDYLITNARVKYEIGDFTIDGYIKNLTNEDVVYLINQGTRASVGQSRTIGLSATYRM
ncbi:MAG: TonB-dependent receptor [Marinomonas foliarum]